MIEVDVLFDDSGHDFVIPISVEHEDFYDLLQVGYDTDDFSAFEEKYGKYRTENFIGNCRIFIMEEEFNALSGK